MWRRWRCWWCSWCWRRCWCWCCCCCCCCWQCWCRYEDTVMDVGVVVFCSKTAQHCCPCFPTRLSCVASCKFCYRSTFSAVVVAVRLECFSCRLTLAAVVVALVELTMVFVEIVIAVIIAIAVVPDITFLTAQSSFATLTTHRPQSSSFLGLPYRILYRNPKKELLWGLWVEPNPKIFFFVRSWDRRALNHEPLFRV